MNEQPETIQISTALELMPELIKTLHFEAAAELRRLHEVNQELVNALEWAYRTALDHDGEWEFDWAIYLERIYQALAKAKGESND